MQRKGTPWRAPTTRRRTLRTHCGMQHPRCGFPLSPSPDRGRATARTPPLQCPSPARPGEGDKGGWGQPSPRADARGCVMSALRAYSAGHKPVGGVGIAFFCDVRRRGTPWRALTTRSCTPRSLRVCASRDKITNCGMRDVRARHGVPLRRTRVPRFSLPQNSGDMIVFSGPIFRGEVPC